MGALELVRVSIDIFIMFITETFKYTTQKILLQKKEKMK
jgi:hypothetical protein